MARSTGPVLAIGAITVVNNTIVNGKEMDWRIPIMTGVAAGGFALVERVWEKGAVTMAYMALVAVLLTRITPGVPSPTESLLNFLEKK